LIYTGIGVFKKVLSSKVYNNFLCLHITKTILCSSYFSSLDAHVNYAEKLLQYFVSNFKEIYGEHHVSHNVHNLLHIVDDVRHFSPLYRFSCFKFENFNQQIKINKNDTQARKAITTNIQKNPCWKIFHVVSIDQMD